MSITGSNKRIFFDLNHPADFHFFKHTIRYLEQNGYSVRIVARDKECLQPLLKGQGFSFISRGKGSQSKTGKYLYAIYNLVVILIQLLKFRPALTLCLSSPYLILTSKILNIPCLTWDDTDYNPRLLPLIKKATYILSPASYPFNFHKYHFHINTFKELAYLHPHYYPKAEQLNRNSVFFRFARMDTIHHKNSNLIRTEEVTNQMNKFAEDFTVYYSNEMGRSVEQANNILSPDIFHIHDVLNSCKTFWGNSATMAAEAAVLGIPAVYVGPQKLAYLAELENYGLLFYFHPKDIQASFNKLTELTNNPSEKRFLTYRQKLLSESIDITALLINFIQDYPDSINELQSLTAKT